MFDTDRELPVVMAWIADLQPADNPGRNEPGTGEINDSFRFGFIDSIGCEDKPASKTSEGLRWFAPFKQ